MEHKGILLEMPSGKVLGSYREEACLPIQAAGTLEDAVQALQTTHRPLGPVLLTRDDRAGKCGWDVRPATTGGAYITACVTIELAYKLACDRRRDFSAAERMVLDLFRAERAITPMVEDTGDDAADNYRERLNMLPPLRWHGGSGSETFRLSEARILDVHPTFCEVMDAKGRFRYFRGLKRIGVTHQEILDECRRLIA